MINVIQIFKSNRRFGKDDYDIDKLEFLKNSESIVTSITGYLEEQTLYLPDFGKQQPDFINAKTIIIQDITNFNPSLFVMAKQVAQQPRWFVDNNKNHILLVNEEAICYCKHSTSLTFDIFKMLSEQPGIFNLQLNYSDNQLAIGIPERDNHKIAELKINKPVRYKLNGKSDFTMTGRKQRTFVEYDYLIEYLGQADKVVFKDWKSMKTNKIKPKQYKLVDERKILK